MDPIDLAERLGRWSAGRGRLSALLAQRLRTLIDDGDLPPGAVLPTDRALAGALAVGRSTVVAAYETLRADGRIVRRQGSGTRVAGATDPQTPADGWTLPTPDTHAPLFLHHLEPPGSALQFACAAPSSPPAALLEAQRAALDQLTETAGRTVDQGYQVGGHPRLRAAIAEHYRGLGLPTDPEQVLVTNGAQQALSLLSRALVQPGDPVLVEAPTYPGALEVLRSIGAELVPQPVGMPGLARTLQQVSPVLTYLVPTFHNPTGAVLGALQGERAARAAVRADSWLIDDRTLADLAFPGVSTPPPLAAHAGDSDKIITVGSLSKAVWGGLRIGWIRAGRSLINRLSRVRALQDLGGTVFNQLAAAVMVEDLAGHLAQSRVQLNNRHDQLCTALRSELPEWSFEPVTGGQFLWVELPRGDADSFAQSALRHGVAVLPGSGLDAYGASTARLRLHFQLPNELARDGIRRLAAAWAEYQPPARPLPDRPKLAV